MSWNVFNCLPLDPISSKMNCIDLTYSIPQNVYDMLVSIAKKLKFSSAQDAADNTISFINCQIDSQVLIPDKVAHLRELLQSSSSELWSKEETVILLAHFLLCYSLNAAVLRFLQYSTKLYDEVLMKLTGLARIYRMYFFSNRVLSLLRSNKVLVLLQSLYT